MSLNAGKILKITITFDHKRIILEEIQKYLNFSLKSRNSGSSSTKKPFILFTPNPEQIVYAQSHKRFADILNRADVALPDGIGIVWASKLLAGKTHQYTTMGHFVRIPGVEFMEDLVRIAADRADRIGLIGGRSGLAVKAYECLHDTYPKLRGWADNGPELGVISGEVVIAHDYLHAVADQIQKTKTHIVFVGLGAPKQEYMIDALAKEMVKRTYNEPLVLMSVGGSFDIITGRLKRAPLVIRSIGFEWAWRLFQEPWRWKRQLALINFIFFVLKAKLRLG